MTDDTIRVESGPGDRAPDGGSGLASRILPRVFFMIGFAILLYVGVWLALALSVLQLVVMLVNRAPNPDLGRFARGYVRYLAEVLAFLVWERDEMPFPFGRYPEADRS